MRSTTQHRTKLFNSTYSSSDKRKDNTIQASSSGSTSSSAANVASGKNGTNTKTFGMTSAISLAYPNAQDLKLTEQLKEALKPYDVFESDQELNHRMEVLAKLNMLVQDWMETVTKEKYVPEMHALNVRGKIYTFGSYRLGVHHKGADIDALCVAPRHIDRSDYFKSFYELLRNQSEVTNLRAVEDAYVPVIKMDFDGIEIDMLFARLALKEIPEDMDLRDNMLLKNLDYKCVLSLNGCRVTDEILRLVPDIENFRLTLRTIKLWAKLHGIYNNSIGYLGGVSWAMLVARTCQLYPNAAAATLVHKFFLVLDKWVWPNPVLLKQPDIINLGFNVWDPRNSVTDRYHLMPIITPVYPHMNSTFNVTISTRTIILKEVKKGLDISNKIMIGEKKWVDLFKVENFFEKYRHFLLVFVRSYTMDDQHKWIGYVESKLRMLIQFLEHNPCISLVHVYPKLFKGDPMMLPGITIKQDCIPVYEPNSPCGIWVIGLQFQRPPNSNITTIDLTTQIQSFTDAVYRFPGCKKLHNEGMGVDTKYIKRRQLLRYLPNSILKFSEQDVAEFEEQNKKDSTLPQISSGSTSPPNSDNSRSSTISNTTSNSEPQINASGSTTNPSASTCSNTYHTSNLASNSYQTGLDSRRMQMANSSYHLTSGQQFNRQPVSNVMAGRKRGANQIPELVNKRVRMHNSNVQTSIRFSLHNPNLTTIEINGTDSSAQNQSQLATTSAVANSFSTKLSANEIIDLTEDAETPMQVLDVDNSSDGEVTEIRNTDIDLGETKKPCSNVVSDDVNDIKKENIIMEIPDSDVDDSMETCVAVNSSESISSDSLNDDKLVPNRESVVLT